MNRITVVRYDENTLWDDYAYLSAVPANVFYHNSSDSIYSNPLLYYKPASADKMENEYQGIKYFMDDWSKYLGGDIDEVVFINLTDPERQDFLNKWPMNASTGTPRIYNNISPYELAGEMAEREWDISGKAVLAVIDEELSSVNIPYGGNIGGVVPGGFRTDSRQISGTIDVGPVPPIYHNFTIDEPYKYISSDMTWGGDKGKDPDLQLYDWNLGQVAASENWNPVSGAFENASSYVYNNGEWAAAVTYMPTESLPVSKAGPVNPADYDIDVDLYPGVELSLPACPYWCREPVISLSWTDAGQKLGLALLGPDGEKVSSSLSGDNPTTLMPLEMGEATYNVSVLKLDNHPFDTSFTISYSWNQKGHKDHDSKLINAAEGAVLASLMNVPLLYGTNESMPVATAEAMSELNVSEIVLLNIGGPDLPDLLQQISDIDGTINVTVQTKIEDIYGLIGNISDSQDVVITTLDPWTKWAINKVPGSNTAAGLYIGPSAFAAAHHGAPLLIAESHEPLSSSKAWHNTYWRSHWSSRTPPSVGDMVITGGQIYEVFDSLGLDSPGMESVLTIAGQYDMGVAWDRTLVGAAIPGRIIGSPTDAAYSICRNLFYNPMIYSNPAMDPGGSLLINGSKSYRDGGDNLQIYDPGGEENYTYPILETWVSYEHRFNERASRYWGANYTCANGVLPYWGETGNPIDDGVNAKYGRPGMYWPDLTNSESLTFYAEKAGYDSVYSTYFPRVADNLNRGVLLWLETMHGGQSGSGILGFWKGGSEPEANPWRAYETYGSTDDPDTMAMRKDTGAETHRSLGEDDRDGVIIAIQEQSHTTHVNGENFDAGLDNIHSTGFLAGSCLIANTYLHLSLIRHGSVFQIIDPWLTSWYASFAYQIFMRALALNYTVGEAYQMGMEFVGIQYLTGQWWWDILENVVYFGDPNLRVYVPELAWQKPASLNYSPDIWLNGHTPFGHYPNALILSVDLNKDIPDQYEDVFLNVTFFNDASEQLHSLPVTLYIDGEERERRSINLIPYVPKKVSWTFNQSKGGPCVLTLLVDPANQINEINETDNNWTRLITVNAIPFGELMVSNYIFYTMENVTLDAGASSDPDGNVSGYLFDMGDGNSSGWQNSSLFNHFYGDDGTYDIRVRVKDDRGAKSAYSPARRVTVLNRRPAALFSVEPEDEIMTFDEISFDASASYDLDGNIINWTWNMGDLSILYGPHVNHSYSDDGPYTVTLSVTDNDGALNWAAFIVVVGNRAPSANFSVEPDIVEGNRSSLFTFSLRAADADGNITNVTWDFGDGTLAYGMNRIYHRYSELGEFEVIVYVTDDDNSTSISIPVIIKIVNIPPILQITMNRSEARTYEPILFEALGSDLDGTTLKYQWDFGDENSSKTRQASHSFSDDGSYDITCSVLDGDNAVTTQKLRIEIWNRAPSAFFLIDNSRLKVGMLMELNAVNSTDRDGIIISYRWDMGDGTVLDGQLINYIYVKAGIYMVNLTVTDDDNSTGYYSLEISVIDKDSTFADWLGQKGIFLGSVFLFFVISLIIVIFLLTKRNRRKESEGEPSGVKSGEPVTKKLEEEIGKEKRSSKRTKKEGVRERKRGRKKKEKQELVKKSTMDVTDESEEEIDWDDAETWELDEEAPKSDSSISDNEAGSDPEVEIWEELEYWD